MQERLGIHLSSGMNLGAPELCIHVPYSPRKDNLPSPQGWTSPQDFLGVLGSWQDFCGAQLLGVAVLEERLTAAPVMNLGSVCLLYPQP